MADTEEYFPRGGKKPTVLFKQTANFLGAPEKSDKKKKRPKKKSEGDDGYLSDDGTREVDQSYKNCAVGLSYQTIKPGVIVLGRVRYVQETKIIVMLPCRLIGNVMACHISEPYNKILEAYVNDQVDKVRELREMFKPGQYIAVKVLEVQGKSLMLSLMPQHVNSEKMVADIVKGTIIQAAVSSIEDHGYVMDIGIPNTKVFLPKKAANPDIELDVGMITWCAVKSTNQSPESSIITVSNSLGAVQGSLLKSKPNLLLPGSNVEFTVDTPLDNGLEGTIFGDVTCYIQRQHVDKVKGKKPALGQKIRARVLYVMPTRLTPFLTMRNVFETTHPDLEEEQLLKDGDIVEDAIVLKISGRSVQFKLGAGSAGVMSLKRLQVDEDLSDEQVIAKSYPIGSSHKVRVLCYNMSDYLYSVTDQPEVVNERYFSIHQLAVGDPVTAAVSAVTDTQLHVTVGRVKGFVPQTHMSEVGVYVDNKKARVSNLSHKKYKVGQSVSGRVLSVDREKPSLVVTLKPSLLAPDLVILKEYTDAQVGHAYTGVVRLIRDYLLVSFFNNVTAFVPRNFVTRDETQNLSDAFHLGQIVTCTILNVRPEDKKMTGSLTTAPFTPDENKKSKLKRKNGDQTKEQDTVKKKKYDEEDSEVKSKKKNKKTEDSDQSVESHDTKKSSKKKQKIEVSAEESDSAEEELQQEPADVKKKKNKHKVEVKSEESDAIETDVNDEEDILTPHEQGLLDMSDCLSLKDFKKRSVALLKAIKVRVKRLQVVNEKISTIEEKGLTSRNKKYHTAMHTEKLLIQQRVEKLQNAHNSAQEKLKELGYEKNESYKEEQKKRKRERTVENKSQKEDKKNVKEDKKSVKEDKKSVKEEGVKKERSKESLKEKIKDIKVAGGQPALEVPSAKEFWAENDEEQKNVKQEESSSSEEEEQEQPKKKRKKLSVAEKLSKLREEEERVRALEAEASGAGGVPRALDQFERAVLSQPSNSQLWIAYMAFHLQATELEKARGVARRALAAIPFRAEHDKGNVWLALLNLEHRFGNRETQQKVLEEALQMNDPYKVHEKLLDILLETGKHQELSSLSDLMIRKYKRSSECYMSVGKALYRANLIDKARQVMQKAIAVLEKKEHVSILVHFALLERSHGGRERCEALFEQVLTAYPQRVDVACVYLDMLGKSTDVDHVRQVLERLTSQKLSARKMKVLYNKWVDIEEKIGDESHAEEIRQRAVQFIEKAKF